MDREWVTTRDNWEPEISDDEAAVCSQPHEGLKGRLVRRFPPSTLPDGGHGALIAACQQGVSQWCHDHPGEPLPRHMVFVLDAILLAGWIFDRARNEFWRLNEDKPPKGKAEAAAMRSPKEPAG